MRRIAPAGTAYLPVQCTVYSLLSHLPDAPQVSQNTPAGTAYLPDSVQTSLLSHLPNATNSVTAMRRIAPAGTAYLLVQCTDIPAP